MQIKKDASANTEKFRSLNNAKASAGKMFESLKPPLVSRNGGVCGSVRLYKPNTMEPAAAMRIGIAVASTPGIERLIALIVNPATIHPSVPSTRIEPKSCFGSVICRYERELVSAIVGM